MAGLRWRVCRRRWRVCRRACARGHFGGFAVILDYPGSAGSAGALTLTRESYPHIHKQSHPLPQTPTPVYRRQSFSLIWDRTGGVRALRARHPQPAATPPVFACTATGGDRGCSTSDERLRPTLVWPRWVEQRGGLLTTAGTVEPGIFACVTRPRRLVKDSKLGAGVSADPGVAPDFPRVCAWAARCRYPDFHRPGAYLCRHVLPHLPMRIAGGARAWWSRGGWRMRSSRPDLQTGKAPQTSTESVDPYAAAWSAERSPVGVMVRRPAKWGRFGPPPNAGAVDQSGIPGGAARIERRSGAAALTGAWTPPRGCGALLGRLSGERWPVSSTSATRAETLRTQAGNAHRPRNLH